MPAPLHTNLLPGRTLVTGSTTYLYFSGTSYLGMSQNHNFQNNLVACFKNYGTNYSSSRLSNVQLNVFSEAEEYLAKWTGADAALTVSSGLVAGQLVLKTLAGKGLMVYGPDTHPALWRFPADLVNGNFEAWSNALPGNVSAFEETNIVIITNSLDALRAKRYSFDWIDLLPPSKNYTLLIDDSHGLGITGKNGTGIYANLKNMPDYLQVVVISSLGKALGIPGGVILSSRPFIEQVKAQAFYGGGSPVVPAYLGAFLQSEKLYQQARSRLQENIQYFTSRLKCPELFQSFPGYPVFYTPHNDLYYYLLERFILISHFSYPSPEHPPITRVVLSSLHTFNDLDLVASEINNYCAVKNLI